MTAKHRDSGASDAEREAFCNFSENRAFTEVLDAHQRQRRAVLKGSLGLAAAGFLGAGLAGCGDASRASPPRPGVSHMGFRAISVSRADTVKLPIGYQSQVFAPWGTPVKPGAAAYRAEGNTGAEQEDQVGSHHDGMHFFPLDATAESSVEGLLVMNHEYVNAAILHAKGPSLTDTRPADEVRKEMAAHGLSILHIARGPTGEWQLVQDSVYNRRITAATPMDIRGPVRGHPKMATRFSPRGESTRGTINNCASGITPWNTFLTAEENWAGYFINRDQPQPREQNRYGVARERSRYDWERSDSQDELCQRFDASAREESPELDYRNEPNHFGWLVEIDPFDPQNVPQKRSALGRFAHEGVVFAKAREGKPLVCYSGDDARHEYIYKFVSARPYAAGAKSELLDEGRLYAARFEDDGSGHWLPLDIEDPEFRSRAAQAGVSFEDQADVLLNTRLAADVAGATKMDRPEWGAIHPNEGTVYFTLTNNDERKPGDENAANPRANNTAGHIIRWRETRGDHAALDFSWDIFLLAGDVGTATASSQRVLTEDNHLASPDGLWFDPRGLLWIQTDLAGDLRRKGPFGNNQMLVADPASGEMKRFLVGPVECEITGITATPDMRTLFINVQHPGESSKPEKFTSHWPDGGDRRPRSATLIISKADGGLIGS